jgi:hypothetical protein
MLARRRFLLGLGAATACRGGTARSLEEEAEAIRQEYWAMGVRATVVEPFVVASVGVPSADARLAINTVRWAVDRLRERYGMWKPADVVTIWLFSGNQSYRAGVWKLFAERPHTSYGYYSPQHHAIVIDLETGTGTLFHELVHPLLAADFESCPPWWNEGLASLYEECEERDDEIIGLTNWRLAELHEALAAGTLPPLRTLMRMTTSQFYGASEGLNYAHARYVCLHLQRLDQLAPFYRAFKSTHDRDPTGEHTLAAHVGDLDAFDEAWRAATRLLQQLVRAPEASVTVLRCGSSGRSSRRSGSRPRTGGGRPCRRR